MPTTRRRTPRSRKQATPLTPALLHYFLHGFPLDHTLEGYPECKGPIFFEPDQLQAIWEDHRDQIIKNHPGVVPYYMKRYDHEA